MAKLSYKRRKKLPSKDFALPGGRYPIEDKAHARNALARASQHASPAEKATIKRKVHQKYPGIKVSGLGSGKKSHKGRKHSARKISLRKG
jgi:hypothetical protein